MKAHDDAPELHIADVCEKCQSAMTVETEVGIGYGRTYLRCTRCPHTRPVSQPQRYPVREGAASSFTFGEIVEDAQRRRVGRGATTRLRFIAQEIVGGYGEVA
jgi:DNA-directed RNA polymerase subunit M/transcription elongation factor TFIIS